VIKWNDQSGSPPLKHGVNPRCQEIVRTAFDAMPEGQNEQEKLPMSGLVLMKIPDRPDRLQARRYGSLL